MITPIIVQQDRNCIISEGARYCEDTDISMENIGYVCLLVAFLIIWFFGAMYVAERNGYIAFWGMLIFPLFTIGIILIF